MMNVIAVDVGTTSVRLAIISFQGQDFNEVNLLSSHEIETSLHQDGVKFEQNSSEIWRAICECCKMCLSKSKILPKFIHGIAFSATCSLVIQQHGSTENDVIMWMDHRAIDEAQVISDSGSKVLEQFGGICSPEFSLSKLLWLKKNQPERLRSAIRILELPDWLVHQCLGLEISDGPQSLCCVVCKWGFDAHGMTHCDHIKTLDDQIFLDRLNKKVLKPGTISGILCRESAIEMGLVPSAGKENTHPSAGIVVGTSLIDAHSGMLAMLSSPLLDLGLKLDIESTFCSLAGTSTCHMTLSRQQKFTKGIWGPYKDVVLDGYYLLEAGQSMTGKLIDLCIESHEEGQSLISQGLKVRDVIKKLNDQINSDSVTSPLYILPTYHGNRSPLANPRLKGGIYGLTAERKSTLLEHYIATVEATIYETKSIIEALGVKLETMLVSGGLMKNSFYMQALADILGCKVVKLALKQVDFMVMGGALIARQAVLNKRLGDARLKSNHVNATLEPGRPIDETSIQNIVYKQLDTLVYEPRKSTYSYHNRKYSCYKEFVDFSLRVDALLNTKK